MKNENLGRAFPIPTESRELIVPPDPTTVSFACLNPLGGLSSQLPLPKFNSCISPCLKNH